MPSPTSATLRCPSPPAVPAIRPRYCGGGGPAPPYRAGSARYASRQPDPQNHTRAPPTSACTDDSTAATAIPHTGSTAVAGTGAGVPGPTGAPAGAPAG